LVQEKAFCAYHYTDQKTGWCFTEITETNCAELKPPKFCKVVDNKADCVPIPKPLV